MITIGLLTLSALVLLTLGVLHLVYTFSGPLLTPRDPALRARMEEVLAKLYWFKIPFIGVLISLALYVAGIVSAWM